MMEGVLISVFLYILSAAQGAFSPPSQAKRCAQCNKRRSGSPTTASKDGMVNFATAVCGFSMEDWDRL